MPSSKRERQLARERYQKKLAREAEEADKRRRRQRIIAAVLGAVAVVALGWLLFALLNNGDNSANAANTTKPTPSPTPTATSTATAAPAALKCTDAPPARDAAKITDGPVDLGIDPKAGTWGWYLDTNCTVTRADGKTSNRVTVAFDPAAAPKTVNSLLFLSDRKNWYDNSSCHRLTTSGIYVLQCGDPTLTGSGGPGYTVPDENLPANKDNNYPAGTIAMANAGSGTTGSQFFIVYSDTTLPPNYSVVGKVTEGLDIVQAIAAKGVAGGGGDGKPAQPIGLTKVVGYRTQQVAQ